MIGRLQMTYGGSPDSWLRIPMGLLRGLADVAEKLTAERQLDQLGVIAAGSGQMKKEDHQAFVRDLTRRAGHQTSRKLKTASEFASAGFNVVEEPKNV